MQHWREPRRLLFSIPLALIALAAIALGTAMTAHAQPRQAAADPPEATDPRALFLDHVNLNHGCFGALPVGMTAGGLGLDPAMWSQIGGMSSQLPQTFTINGATVTASTTGGNMGPLNLSGVPAGTVVYALVLDLGDNVNLFGPPALGADPSTVNAAVLPPAVAPPQNYVPPLNDGGHTAIYRWFLCYQTAPPPPPPAGTGNVTVFKAVNLPVGIVAGGPLPTSYSATANCGTPTPLTFGALGGQSTPAPALSGVTGGTACTVTEATPDPRATVTYVVNDRTPTTTPASFDVVAGTTTVVTIINDFTNAALEMGTLQFEKVVSNPGGAPLPADWTVNVACDAQGTDLAATVTMPAAGGAGTPVLHPEVTAGCDLAEANVPAGWTVSYSVDGGPSTSTPPTLDIVDTSTITVTVTNTGPAPTPSPSPSPGAPGLPSTGAPPSGGGLPLPALGLAGLIAAMGAGVALRARR